MTLRPRPDQTDSATVESALDLCQRATGADHLCSNLDDKELFQYDLYSILDRRQMVHLPDHERMPQID